jgi:hypothetical protein
MKNHILLLSVLVLCCTAQAADNEAGTAAIKLFIKHVQSNDPLYRVPQNKIEGSCFYKGTGCNGAEIKLLDSESKVLSTQVITSGQRFHFHKLDPSKEYTLELNYPRYSAYGTLKKVRSGNHYSVDAE